MFTADGGVEVGMSQCCELWSIEVTRYLSYQVPWGQGKPAGETKLFKLKMKDVPETLFTHLTVVPGVVPDTKNFPSLPSDASQTPLSASLCLPPSVMCPSSVPPWDPYV